MRMPISSFFHFSLLSDLSLFCPLNVYSEVFDLKPTSGLSHAQSCLKNPAHLSHFFTERTVSEQELVLRFAAAEVTAVSMEMIPRTTAAQKMDVLSS